MNQPKYTCANCESEKEPYFSRSEPMGFFCVDCGRDFDERDLQDAKNTAEHWKQKAKHADEAANDLVAELIDTRREWKEKLAAERALADRLAFALTNPATYVAVEALTAWKEARSE